MKIDTANPDTLDNIISTELFELAMSESQSSEYVFSLVSTILKCQPQNTVMKKHRLPAVTPPKQRKRRLEYIRRRQCEILGDPA